MSSLNTLTERQTCPSADGTIMIRYRDELLKFMPHAIVLTLIVICWDAKLPAVATLVIGSLFGAFFHTMADTAIEPERGDARLRYTVIGNLLFSILMAGVMTFGLYGG